MKKRITAFLLIAASLLGTMCGVSAAGISDLDQAVAAMLTFTKQDRADMLTHLW